MIDKILKLDPCAEMKTMCYKLTDQNRCTHGGFKWNGNRWYETNGEGYLCGPGWLHAYSHPLLAVMMNPIHADIKNPRIFEARGGGECRGDRGLKCGFTRLRLVREMPVPDVTTPTRVAFGILCAKAVTDEPGWNKWANGWLSGKDRSANAANAAAYDANTACAANTAYANAAYAAANAAAYDAYAAKAAAYAAAYAANTAYANAELDLAAIACRAMEVQ